MGFLGILEDKHLQHVPATVILKEGESQTSNEGTAGLKHGKGKDADIVLVPQPYVHCEAPVTRSELTIV
jgi:hypothetical protein